MRADMKANFLNDEKPAAAIDSAALEKAFVAAVAEAKRLRAVEDPEETPFVSRYEERNVLGKVARQAAANAAAEPAGSVEARRASVIEALANGLIGRNFMETEEPSSAQSKLEAAIAGLEGVPEESAAHVEVLNSLGVLWANRSETEKSLELLERSRAAHAKAKKDEKVMSDPEALQRLEDQYTLTTFYLAQAYGLLGKRTESAAHCHQTMVRQLARRGRKGGGEFAFDSTQWARNAQDLSKYYCAVDRYDVAEHCLRAAQAILTTARQDAFEERTALAAKRAEEAAAVAAKAKAETAAAAAAGGTSAEDAVDVSDTAPDAAPDATAAKPGMLQEGELVEHTVCLDGTAEDKEVARAKMVAAAAAAAAAPPEELTEDEAEGAAALDVAWADLYLCILRRAWLLKQRARGKAVEDDGFFDEKEGIELGAFDGLCFAALELPYPSALCAAPAAVRTFEAARDVYKQGAAHAARAKAVFILDGYVTMHFEVIEREVELYSQLAKWEPDFSRRHAMHKRRIALLQPPLLELNEKAYTQLVRQGLFDISTIAAEMLEIKCAIVTASEEAPPKKLRKLEKEVEAVAEACEAFLSRFYDDKGEPPAKVDEEQERAYLTCRFHLARAHGKLPSADAIAAGLKQYEIIDKYLKSNQVDGMEEEAKVCSEMVELLPHKLAAAKRAINK